MTATQFPRKLARATVAAVMLGSTSLCLGSGVYAADTDKSEPKEQTAKDELTTAKNAAHLIEDAEATLNQLMERPRFRTVMQRAKGVIIFPSLLKAGYFVGGKSGAGLLALKRDDGTWSYPAFYQVTGGTFGLQIGASVSQVAIALMSDAAVDAAVNGNLKLGGELGVAIGPAAVDAGIDTNYDMLTFTISNGLFAGVALDGSTITKTVKRNQAFYGREVKTRDILITQTVEHPAAEPLRESLMRASTPGT